MGLFTAPSVWAPAAKPVHKVVAYKIHPQRITDNAAEGREDELIFELSTGLGITHRKLATTKHFSIGTSDEDLKIDWPLFTIDWNKPWPYYRITVTEKDDFSGPDFIGSFTIDLDRNAPRLTAEQSAVWDGQKMHLRGGGARYWIWFAFKK